MKKLLLVLPLLITTACSDKASPLEPCDGSKIFYRLNSHPIRPFPSVELAEAYLELQQPATAFVSSEEELYAALTAGHSAIYLATAITLTKTLVVNEHVAYNHFSIEGPGGFNGNSIWRGFSDGPLIKVYKDHRDWELRFKGVSFEGPGTSLDIDYVQLGIFEDLRFVFHEEPPFIIRHSNLTEYRDIFVTENTVPAEMLRTNDFRWRGGAVEDHRGRNGGLHIEGPDRTLPNSYPGPGLIEDRHQEGTKVKIKGVDDLTILRGYHFYSSIECEDCRGRFFVNGGSWPNSFVTQNGKHVYPEACTTKE